VDLMGLGEDTAAANRDQADIHDPDQSKHNQPPETPIEVATAIAAIAAEESWSMMNLLLWLLCGPQRARPSLLIDQAWASA
jgi:hypothetical protein